jgi:hypothetical protein
MGDGNITRVYKSGPKNGIKIYNRIYMKKLFSLNEFAPDISYVQVLQVVSDDPGCTITHVVTRLFPKYNEYAARSRVRQLILRDYISENCPHSEILLTISAKGQAFLQKPAP